MKIRVGHIMAGPAWGMASLRIVYFVMFPVKKPQKATKIARCKPNVSRFANQSWLILNGKDDTMESKERLVFLRKSRKMSQNELAEKLSVSRQTVSRWECGAVTIGAENLAAISKLFGVSMESIMNLDTPPAQQEGQTVQSEQGKQEETVVRPEQAGQEARAEESPQEIPRKKRFLRWLAAAGAGIGILAIGLYIGAKFFPDNAQDDVPVNALPPDGTYTMDISTEDGDYEIWYEKYRIIRQDEIEPEEIDMSQIEDGSDGWTVIEE